MTNSQFEILYHYDQQNIYIADKKVYINFLQTSNNVCLNDYLEIKPSTQCYVKGDYLFVINTHDNKKLFDYIVKIDTENEKICFYKCYIYNLDIINILQNKDLNYFVCLNENNDLVRVNLSKNFEEKILITKPIFNNENEKEISYHTFSCYGTGQKRTIFIYYDKFYEYDFIEDQLRLLFDNRLNHILTSQDFYDGKTDLFCVTGDVVNGICENIYIYNKDKLLLKTELSLNVIVNPSENTKYIAIINERKIKENETSEIDEFLFYNEHIFLSIYEINYQSNSVKKISEIDLTQQKQIYSVLSHNMFVAECGKVYLECEYAGKFNTKKECNFLYDIHRKTLKCLKNDIPDITALFSSGHKNYYLQNNYLILSNNKKIKYKQILPVYFKGKNPDKHRDYIFNNKFSGDVFLVLSDNKFQLIELKDNNINILCEIEDNQHLQLQKISTFFYNITTSEKNILIVRSNRLDTCYKIIHIDNNILSTTLKDFNIDSVYSVSNNIMTISFYNSNTHKTKLFLFHVDENKICDLVLESNKYEYWHNIITSIKHFNDYVFFSINKNNNEKVLKVYDNKGVFVCEINNFNINLESTYDIKMQLIPKIEQIKMINKQFDKILNKEKQKTFNHLKI